MTVKNKLETALASAKGLAADLKTFSLDTKIKMPSKCLKPCQQMLKTWLK